MTPLGGSGTTCEIQFRNAFSWEHQMVTFHKCDSHGQGQRLISVRSDPIHVFQRTTTPSSVTQSDYIHLAPRMYHFPDKLATAERYATLVQSELTPICTHKQPYRITDFKTAHLTFSFVL
ncbi:hypothetical protein CRM22_008892 [Opisthorchis felineus]|uniref:Uncharacterized protein n=1 Tax=Opisthorchis felineus TaxID=147828 RepID=A0A4S2L9V5_OPIFE|nr:hypothetical protein CRM22_008892 [Opisthorchis felineus]